MAVESLGISHHGHAAARHEDAEPSGQPLHGKVVLAQVAHDEKIGKAVGQGQVRSLSLLYVQAAAEQTALLRPFAQVVHPVARGILGVDHPVSPQSEGFGNCRIANPRENRHPPCNAAQLRTAVGLNVIRSQRRVDCRQSAHGNGKES